MKMKIPTMILVCLSVIAIFVSCKQTEEYQVYALKYADAGMVSAKEPIIGANQIDSVDVTYMFWLLKDPRGKNILVDAGFIDSTHSTKNYVRPDSILNSLNITSQDISDIIITHPHYDHIGGITLFPNATIWMNKDDYEYFIGPAWKPGGVSIGLNKIDVNNITSLESEGKLRLFEGDNVEIMPGIKAYTGSKHTFENFFLIINSNSTKNKILLASDASWFYLNLERELPISLSLDTASYVKAIKRMKTLVTNQNLIIPGHDNRVFLTFPKVQDRIVRLEETN